MGDRVTLAKKLLDSYPSKAQELLIDYLQDKDVRTATEQYIGQHNPAPVRPDAAIEQQSRTSRTRSYQLDSSVPHGTTRHNILDARHGLYTPSHSAPSVKSHASSLTGAGLEKIYLLSCDDEGADQPVMARNLPTKHNLIRDKVAYGRGLGASIHEVDEVVTLYLSSGVQRLERVTRSVSLFWRRRKEFTTNDGTFFVVPANLLDSDVVLGADDSIERQLPCDVEEAHSPQTPYLRGGIIAVEEHDPAIRPQAPTAPMHPYQQSSLPPTVQRTYDRVQAFRDIQRMNLPERTAPTSQPRHSGHSQENHTTPPLAEQGPPGGQLQVTGVWDRTPIRMSFDPGASGEKFYQDFCQWAERRDRGGDIERDKMTLWFKTNKSTPDKQAYDLDLKEDELDELWETAVDWIQENKNSKAPHLYVTVELGPG